MKINIIKYYFYAKKARCNMSITPTLHRIFHHQLSYALLFLRTSRRPLHRAVPESSSDTAFAAYQYAAPLLSDLHAEITAVISTPQRHASLPDQLRMQPGIADVITVAKAAAQLRAAIFCAGVVIGTYRKRCSVPLPAQESAVPQSPGNHGKDRFPSSSSSVTLSFCIRSRSRARRRQGCTAAQNLSRRPLRSWCSPDGTKRGSGRTAPAPSSAHRCRTW